jgi:predicted alpha/beta hydrolase
MRDVAITTPDGWTLYGAHRAGAGRGVVLCGHAMMVNARSFEKGAAPAVLAARGYEVYTFDLRGHGRSRGPRPWNYDDLMLRDLPALVRGVRARHPGLPLAVVGHSLTGHGCLGWLGLRPDAPVDAVVAVAANLWLPRWEPRRLRWLKKRAVLEAWLGASRLFGRFPARAFRIGSDDVALAYVRQFVGWARRDEWKTADGRDYLAGLERVRCPVLAILGEADRLLCAPESGRAFVSHLRAPLTVWEVGRTEIPGLVPDHMRLVTDPRAAPLWERIAGWLDTVLAGGRKEQAL